MVCITPYKVLFLLSVFSHTSSHGVLSLLLRVAIGGTRNRILPFLQSENSPNPVSLGVPRVHSSYKYFFSAGSDRATPLFLHWPSLWWSDIWVGLFQIYAKMTMSVISPEGIYWNATYACQIPQDGDLINLFLPLVESYRLQTACLLW